MADYKRTFEISFDAGVGRTGHHYRVEATTHVRYEPKTGETTDMTLLARMLEIRNELHERSLNEMLPAVPATPGGLATYFMERLSMGHPRLYKVRVWTSEQDCVTLTREIRQ